MSKENGKLISDSADIEANSNDQDNYLQTLMDDLPESIIRESLTIAKVMHERTETSIADKMTSEHISEFLDASRKNMELSYTDKNKQRFFLLVIFSLVVVLILSIVLIFRNNHDIVEKILFAAGGLVAGAIGGFGFGKSKKDDE